MRLVPLTEKHITEGKPAKCYGCPIALALGDAGMSVSVNMYHSRVDGRIVAMSVGMSAWVYSFDHDDRFSQAQGEPRPFTIVVDADRMSTLDEWQEAHR